MARHRHPAARRKHEEQVADDAFIARLLEAWVWLRRHSRAMVVAVVGLAIVLAGGFYYRSYRASLRVQAAEELELIQQTLAAGGVQTAKGQLETFLTRFGGTAAAAEARMLLGQLHLESGDPQAAIQVLEPMARDLGTPLGLQAALLLGAAYEQTGRGEDAAALYLRAADAAPLHFQKRDALAAAARIRAQSGDPAASRDLYRRLLETLPPDHPDRALYELRVAEHEARATATAAHSP